VTKVEYQTIKNIPIIGKRFLEKERKKMKKPLMTLGVEEKPEMKSPIDSLIVDLILEHFNVQSLEGRDEILTGDQFSELIKLAEGMYYEEVTKHQKLGLA
tara:strand:+ start:132 stop:431 length:300 start_codon:yes stop_codon:yes gene_type:complete